MRNFFHSPALSERFPGNYTGVAVIRDVVAEAFVDAQRDINGKLTQGGWQDACETSVRAWGQIFTTLGAKESMKPSVAALLTSFTERGGFYHVDPKVNFFNGFSLFTGVPMGAYDASFLSGNIALEASKEREKFIRLGGTKPEKTQVGEVVYRDAQGVICRCWNYKDSDRTRVREATNNILIFMDLLANGAADALAQVAEHERALAHWFGEKFSSIGIAGPGICHELELG